MISVIIPVYNSASKGLEECLQRVASQTFTDLQVLLVDDGATDDSGKICDEWALRDQRFEVVHQKNQGPAAARNTALDRIKGEEIAFVDSDDLPVVNMLQVLHEALNSSPAEMAMARYSESATVHVKLTEGCVPGAEMLKGLFDYHTPLYKNLFAKLYKRELLENLAFEPFRTSEDVDFLSKVYLRVKRCAFVDQNLYIYNRCEGSVMHTQTARDYLDIVQCYEQMVVRFSALGNDLYGRALDALMRKIVSSRYRNRSLKDSELRSRLDALEKKYLPAYFVSKNGSLLVKIGLLTCLKLPWLHAMVMDYRER